MRLVILESPFAGRGKTIDARILSKRRHIAYAQAAVRDSLARGESPFASHLFFARPGILDDYDAEQRRLGILAGLAWGRRADATVVYQDLGISPGMREGIERAVREGRAVQYRKLGDW